MKLEELVLKVILDTRGVVDGQKKLNDSSKKSSDQMQAGFKATSNMLNKIKNEVFALTAAFLGLSAIKAVVTGIVTADSATARLARNIDISTSALSAFEKISEKLGSNAGDVDASFMHINEMVTSMRTGISLSPAELQGMGRMGIGMPEFLNKKDDAERMMLLYQKIKDFMAAGHTHGEVLQFGQMAGFSPTILKALMDAQSEGLQSLLDKQLQIGVATERSGKITQQLKNDWVDVSNTIEDAGRSIVLNLYPQLHEVLLKTEYITGEIGKWFQKGTTEKSGYEKFTDAISGTWEAAGDRLGGSVGMRALRFMKNGISGGMSGGESFYDDTVKWMATPGHQSLLQYKFPDLSQQRLNTANVHVNTININGAQSPSATSDALIDSLNRFCIGSMSNSSTR